MINELLGPRKAHDTSFRSRYLNRATLMPGLRKGVVAFLWPRNSVRSTEMQLMSVRAFNGQKTQLTSASLVLRSQNIAVL